MEKYGDGYIKKFETIAEKVVTRVGLKVAKAAVIVGAINALVQEWSSFSVGSLFTYIMKLKFKTEYRKEKKYIWFGKKQSIEYFVF